MADDGSKQSKTVWPTPRFSFEVKWGDMVMHFQEASGLDAETPVIEYRHGSSAVFDTIDMPGLNKVRDVTMKRGIVPSDSQFWAWFDEIKMGTIKRSPVTVILLDEAGSPKMVWTLADAWPTKVTGADLKADGDEIAIETMEFSHEGLTVVNA